MTKMHHKPIKRFGLDGTIADDSGLWRLRLEYTRLILLQMRLSGYVPRFDIPVDFTIEYNDKQENFNFEMSIYGIYVGKRKSEWILGVHETTILYAPPSKSNEYLSESA
jgi:hypothetical protein